ncbi:MAG: hypothetical protein KBA31_09690 [Alphaproteobacteria bacterium]|nr:hypothetical protein [Alphaproteobacteria bacterium]
MRRNALLATVSLVTLTACEGVDATTPSKPTPSQTQQTWLCGREYVNHAWGYQRYGAVLDTAGNIWRYKIERVPAGQARPWDPRDMTTLTDADLKMRYEGAMVVSGKKVPLPEVEKNFPLIADAAEAKPTQPSPRGADMGQTLTYCYTYDANARTYSQVMLDNKGDWDSTNPSQAGKNLTSWVNGWLGDIN